MPDYIVCAMCNSPVFCMGRGLCTTGSPLKELPRMRILVDNDLFINGGNVGVSGAAKLPDMVDHPPHYGGAADPYEAIKVIDAWDLGFCDGNVLKYLSRWRRKGGLEDLKKAEWYLAHLIEHEKLNGR